MALTDRARVVPGGMVDVRQAHYQDSKERIHRALLNRLNLDRLNRVGREEAEPEIRSLIVTLLDSESSNVPLSMSEREALIADVLNELFGLGPARSAARATRTISDILVNRFDQIYVEREGRLEPSPTGVQGRPAPAAHHRADRQLGRPAHRRVEPDGRRPPAPTARVSTRSSRRWRSTARCCRSAASAPTASAPSDLVERQSLTQPMLEFLRGAVGARLNILVSGGTGAGKTTLPQRALGLHLGARAHRHHRGCRRTDAAAAARRPARDAPGQHRGQGRGQPARSW